MSNIDLGYHIYYIFSIISYLIIILPPDIKICQKYFNEKPKKKRLNIGKIL